MAGPLRDPGPRARRALARAAGRPDGASRGHEPAGGSPSDGAPVEPVPGAPAPPADGVEDWTLDQLRHRAAELGLEGRRHLTREELVAALRGP